MPPRHIITAIVEGQQVSGFISGNIESSLITPADSFVLRLPSSRTAWETFKKGARTVIKADGVTLLDGFVDKRIRKGKARVIEVSGRDRVGRLVDESADAINFTGMRIVDAIKRLASPWFEEIVLDNGKNRRLRRGRGRRVASGTEPTVTINVKVPRRGNVHPGESRWQLIHEIASRADLIVYSSADGRTLFVGHANQDQAAQYLFCLGAPGSSTQTTVIDMTITEDDGERYSMIMCGGVGGQTPTDYGKNVIDRRGVVFDNIFNRKDGTGRDFVHPKKLYLPERAFDSFHDAQRVAELEQRRRDYKRHLVSVEMLGFGQYLGTSEATLFAPDTVAHVIDEEIGIDDDYQVVECSYSFDHDQADRTTCHCVPKGTNIVL